MRALLYTPGFERPLLEELRAGFPSVRPVEERPGMLLVEGLGDAVIDPVFSRQQLKDPARIEGASIKQLAEAAFAAIEKPLDGSLGPWSLHVTVPDLELHEPLLKRVAILETEVVNLFKERRRRTFRRLAPSPLPEGGMLAQVVLFERERGLASVGVPAPLPHGGTEGSLWPGGRAPVEEDRAAPSRAYRKLEEAFRWLNLEPQPGERCVDLGGSPGGWTWTALKRGAFVTAIDRAPLEPPAHGHPKLTEIIGNALAWEPPSPLDWMVCDVICEPEKSVALVERWLTQKWCRRLVTTVKFKGTDKYGVLAALPGIFERAGVKFGRVKHLAHNKNEVEVMAAF